MTTAWRLSIAAAGLACAVVWAAEKPGMEPDVETIRYSSVQKLESDLTLAQLSNGLTVIVQENHSAPVATVRCYVKNTGSAYEGQWMGAGLSHVLEHVVAGGSTSRRTEAEIKKIVDSFGGATNAFTSNEMTAFFIDCPAKDTLLAVDLVADSMQHVKFEPAEFERELKVIRRELADAEVNRQDVLHDMLDQTVYTTSPARHPVIGYLDVLNKTKNQTIIDFYRLRYVPENQIFVVVGDVETQKVLDEVLKQWSQTRRSYSPPIALPAEPDQLAPREAIREMPGATVDLALAWPTVDVAHPDLYALDMAAAILSDGESSRLVRRLKYERQLVLGIQAMSQTPHYVRGWFGVVAIVRPECAKEAAEEILREIDRLCKEPVGAVELARAKKQKVAELIFERQTVQKTADSLGRSFVTASDPLFDKHYVERLQNVTAEQIRAVARRYFVPERLNRIMLVPPGTRAKEAQSAGAAKSAPEKLVRLPNGLRVLVKRQANLPLVNVQAYVLAGSLADSPETAGRSALVAEMLDKGTPSRSAEQIAQFFDSIGGQFQTSAGRNTVFASATMLREDFPAALEAVADCFLHPTFADEEFAQVKQVALGAAARRADDPKSRAMEIFLDNLPAESPYHVVDNGKKETLERVKPADLKAYHAKWFVPNNMLVSVFGDVDPDTALKLVERQFGSLKPAADFKPVDFNRPNAVAKDAARHLKIVQPTGLVVLGYPESSIFEKEDIAAMTVLDTIMSGYKYPGGWLHDELRGEGLVYWVHANQMTGPAPGFFIIAAQTRPDKVDDVVGRFRKAVDRAKAGRISKEEFDAAKALILAFHAQEDTTVTEQARRASLDELLGLGHDYNQSFEKRIGAVTQDDVVRVAKKYLNRSVLVTLSPNGK